MMPPEGSSAVGYVVLTKNLAWGWDADWDGEVHPTEAQGQSALADCASRGWGCALAALVICSDIIEESHTS